jgi:hypothetical protein
VGQEQYGRGGGKFGEGTGGNGQCAAHRASRYPRGGARWAPGLGEPTEGRVRRGLPGGDRGSSGSGEQTARPSRPVLVHALLVCGEGLGALERRREHTKWEAHRVAPMADGGGSGSREEGRRRPFIPGREAVGVLLARQGN